MQRKAVKQKELTKKREKRINKERHENGYQDHSS